MSIAEKYDLALTSSTDNNYYVIGETYGSFRIGEGEEEFVGMVTEPTDELRELIARAVSDMGLEPIKPFVYSIGYCSY